MRKKILALLLALACGLLAGCAPAAEPDAEPDGSDIAGADWRTWGIINDMGTLVRDAERIDVCVCVHTEDAAIYYDTAEQVLLDEAFVAQWQSYGAMPTQVHTNASFRHDED